MINSYVFVDKLSDLMAEGDIIVTGVGTAYTGTHQSIKLKKNQRLISNIGCGGMGYGLPAAIGAQIASGKRVILIDGDGGLQMNIQELQTIVHHKLPVKIFILNNQGYQAILITQKTYFRRFGGIDVKTGVSFPQLQRIAQAYKIKYFKLTQPSQLVSGIKKSLKSKGPVITEIFMPKDQPLWVFVHSLYKNETQKSVSEKT
jgi:acetolactate synthase I/II/III large subunit